MAVVRSKHSDVAIPDDIRSFPTFILRKFDEHGDLIAIVDSATDKSYTYSQISMLSKKCGSALVRLGLQPGDVLAIILPNMIEYPVVFYGVTSIGGIATTLNPLYSVHELVYQLRDSLATYVIAIPEMLDKVQKAVAQCSTIRRVLVLGDAPGHESFEKMMLNDDGSAFSAHVPINWKEDVVCMPYSSGTTGLPKGVMLTHYNLIAHTCVLAHPDRLKLQHDIQTERMTHLAIVPMFHIYGLSIMLGLMMYLGSKLVCMRQFDVMSFLKAIQDYKVTNLALVPPLFIFLAKHPRVKDYDLSSVVSVGCGAAPLGDGVINDLKSRMPSVQNIGQGYGLTEVSAACMTTPPNIDKPASVGKVIPNLQVKVIDLKTGVMLPGNKEGEICVKGPTIMKGYFNKPEATAATIDKDGWLHTGDIGYYDDLQHFFIVGRVKELIKYKGFQVPPAELEDLLQSHPKIADAAVIGIPDTNAGEIPKAFVVLREGSHGITPQDIVTFVADNVSPHKKLRGGVEFVESIPKNPSGKILRRQLSEKEAEKIKLRHKL